MVLLVWREAQAESPHSAGEYVFTWQLSPGIAVSHDLAVGRMSHDLVVGRASEPNLRSVQALHKADV